MPDVREVFDSTTKELRPMPGALDRQRRRQQRHRAVERATAVGVVACMTVVVGILVITALPMTGRRAPIRPLHVGPTGSPSVLTVNAATGVVTRSVVEGVAPDSRAAISPDGSSVAFVRPFGVSEQIFVTTGGGDAVRLTGPGKGGCGCGSSEPAWSPDGRRIAFAGMNAAGIQNIYVVNVATGRLDRVTRSDAYEAAPSWSPDGRMIAFTSGGHNTQFLWVVNVATGTESRIARMRAAIPAWSPDGRTIAFSHPGERGADGSIWLIGPDGSGLRRLASATAESDGNLSWSPDGTQLAFAAIRTTGKPPFVDVDVADVATGEVRVLATGVDYPSWSADGRFILALRP